MFRPSWDIVEEVQVITNKNVQKCNTYQRITNVYTDIKTQNVKNEQLK